MTTALLLLALSAHAYETDNLTGRDQPLPDVREELSAYVDDVLAEAVALVNERTGCGSDDEETRRLLARAIHHRTAGNEMVRGRGGLRSLGFDHTSAFIEKGGVARLAFLDRSDLFGDLSFKEAPLLKWAGVCSTVSLVGYRVGTDKLDHFFEEGYDAWRIADHGEDPDAALAWMTHTENTKYGLETSETFSFADLRADWDGYHFYDELLTDASVLQRGVDGCVVQVEPFDWGDWITWEYDEVLNPSVHTESVQLGLDRTIAERRDAICASYAVWGGPWYEAHLATVLATRAEYVTDEAPERTLPYDLPALCAAD